MLTELEARLKRLERTPSGCSAWSSATSPPRVTYDEKLTQVREYEARVAAQKDRIDDLAAQGADGRRRAAARRRGRRDRRHRQPTTFSFWVGQPNAAARRRRRQRGGHPQGQGRPEGAAAPRRPPRRSAARRRSPSITPKGDPETKTFRVYSRPARRHAAEDRHERRGQHRRSRGKRTRCWSRPRPSPTAAVQVVETAACVACARSRPAFAARGWSRSVSGLEPGRTVVSPFRAELTDGARVSACGKAASHEA